MTDVIMVFLLLTLNIFFLAFLLLTLSKQLLAVSLIKSKMENTNQVVNPLHAIGFFRNPLKTSGGTERIEVSSNGLIKNI